MSETLVLIYLFLAALGLYKLLRSTPPTSEDDRRWNPRHDCAITFKGAA